MTNDTFGHTFGRPFAFYDPESRSLRTWPDIDPKDSQPFSGTVPKTGFLFTGGLYELLTSAPRTDESVCSSLLPTPAAQMSGNTPEDHLRKKPGRTQVTDLKIIVEHGLLETGGKLLPTPRTTDAHGSGHHGSGGLDLRTATASLGENTSRPSDDGNKPLAGQLQLLLNLTKTEDHDYPPSSMSG